MRIWSLVKAGYTVRVGSFRYTYEDLKLIYVVFNVPDNPVLDIPMRIWSFWYRRPYASARSFRYTYEDLKPKWAVLLPKSLASFRYTYEDLKLYCVVCVWPRLLSFRYTYEDLKPGKTKRQTSKSGKVLDIPMRIWSFLPSFLLAEANNGFRYTYEDLKLKSTRDELGPPRLF